MGFAVGIALGVAVVFWVLHPVVAGLHAPMGRDDQEPTEVQHRKRMALLALRDVEYDYHAGKLDERDYRTMKREISSEALEALDAEAREWAVREGKRAARNQPDDTPQEATGSDALEAEVAALRRTFREGVVCRECGTPGSREHRFCQACGGALKAPTDTSPPRS